MQNNDAPAVIRSVQELLRAAQIADRKKVTVPVDGIYGEATANAVRDFQRESGLEVTGRVDKATYDALYERSLEDLFQNSEPLPLYLLGKGQTLRRGEQSDTVLILQVLLNALSLRYDHITPTVPDGIFGENTESAVRIFQMRNGLPPSGEVDKRTWNALIKNYDQILPASE